MTDQTQTPAQIAAEAFRSMFDTEATLVVHHATKAKAVKLATTLTAEYPALVLDFDQSEGVVTSWYVEHFDGEFGVRVVEGAKVPELADVLEACAELELDPELFRLEAEEEEEDRVSRTVVPEKYRAAYREASSNGQTCGDWLAEWLVEQTTNADGNLDVEVLQAIFRANGVDETGAWARLPVSGQRGWQGRFRMNGRQLLEKRIAFAGALVGADMPTEEIALLQAKHAKWLAKVRKVEAAQVEIAKGAEEA